MATNFNKAIIFGRLTHDPELRQTSSGKFVTNFCVCTNHYWVGDDGVKKEHAEFHQVVAWGKLAEMTCEYLSRGREILVEGKLQSKIIKDSNGVEKRITQIIAETASWGANPHKDEGGHASTSERAPGASLYMGLEDKMTDFDEKLPF